MLILFIFSNLSTARSQTGQRLTLLNKSDFNRSDEVISIPRNQLKPGGLNSYPLVKSGNEICISQLIDEDADGKWDQLLIQVNLEPNTKSTLNLEWVKEGQVPDFIKSTNVRFSLKSKSSQPEKEISFLERKRGFTQIISDPVYQMEGPGIENDKVAFRAFFDKRNGKDIYGKLVSDPVLDQVGLKGSWHSLQDWGMDILRTGNSLGAGALGVKNGENISRLADADKTTFQALYEGPLKAAFILKFKNWDVAGSLKDGSEKMSVIKGDYFYTNEIGVKISDAMQLISGIANFGTDELVYKKHNSKFSSVSIYGPQADGTKTNLGLAVLFEAKKYAGKHTTLTTDSIPNTSYVVLNPSKNDNCIIRFFSCWEKTDPIFSTKEGFENYLQQVADKLAQPIKVKL